MKEARGARIPYQLLVIVGFCLWGLVTTIFNYEAARMRGDEPHLGVWILGGQLIWLYWAAVVPLIVSITRRIDSEGGLSLKGATAHLIASLVIAFAHMVYLYYAYVIPELLFSTGDYTARFRQIPTLSHLYGFRLPLGIVYYFAITGVVYAVDLYRRYSEKTLRAAQLEAELKQAQLLSLKMQLQPHFLFNALHSIVALISTGKSESAARATVGLGGLLRHSLDEIDNHEVTFSDEIDYINKYIELEKLRFDDQLSLVLKIEDRALRAFVPSLILQPLIENAIKHGTQHNGGSTEVVIEASVEGDNLRLAVRNIFTADDRKGAIPHEERLGHSITRQRLNHMYGDDYCMTAGIINSGEYVVELVIPYADIPLWG